MKRRRYSKEYKIEAVKLLKEQGYTYSKASEALGVTPTMLNRWRKQLEDSGDLAFPGNGNSSESQELRELREENRRLKLEREILKKAAAFFAKEES